MLGVFTISAVTGKEKRMGKETGREKRRSKKERKEKNTIGR